MNEQEITIEKDMELINKLSRRKLSAEEVYVFPVVLCDNETDRDCERFSIKTLERLAELFVGKTGIFDHDPKGANQTARIFFAETVSDPARKTRSGEVYTFVRAKAYMMRTEKNADFITEIDGGIKKEVSVCCAVKHEICSICGTDRRVKPCTHAKGGYYGGKLCEGILDEAEDAYEWSFVAVPAQPNAGITKSLGAAQEGFEIKALRKRLDETQTEVSKAVRDITAEIVRLGQFCVPAYTPETVRCLCAEMSVAELLEFKERTRKLAKTERLESTLAQSGGQKEPQDTNGKFKLKA